MIHYIRNNKHQVVAMYVTDRERQIVPNQNNFITSPDAYLQVGIIHREAGAVFPRHQHLAIERTFTGCAEVLVIEAGVIEADIYDTDDTFLARFLLHQGDLFIQYIGGHEFRVIQDVSIIEVKQGPYAPEYKVFFNPLLHENMK